MNGRGSLLRNQCSYMDYKVHIGTLDQAYFIVLHYWDSPVYKGWRIIFLCPIFSEEIGTEQYLVAAVVPSCVLYL